MPQETVEMPDRAIVLESEGMTRNISGKDHSRWKEDGASLNAIHAWAKRGLLKKIPLKCTQCGSVIKEVIDTMKFDAERA